MKTVLLITSYRYEGKIESYTRSYLPTDAQSAVAQAKEYFDESRTTVDYNSEVHYTELEISDKTVRDLFDDDHALILSCGRICALESVANGAPAIPVDTEYADWERGCDAFDGDYNFVRQCLGRDLTEQERADFRKSFLCSLFEESEAGPELDHDDDCACVSCKQAREKGLDAGASDARNVCQEQGIDVLRSTLKPGQLGWDEAAINAQAYEIDCGDGPSRAAYYAAYEEGARLEAEEISAEEAAHHAAQWAIDEGFLFYRRPGESRKQQISHLPLDGDFDYLRTEALVTSDRGKKWFVECYREYLLDHAEYEPSEE